jgi:hypothetical protein
MDITAIVNLFDSSANFTTANGRKVATCFTATTINLGSDR